MAKPNPVNKGASLSTVNRTMLDVKGLQKQTLKEIAGLRKDNKQSLGVMKSTLKEIMGIRKDNKKPLKDQSKAPGLSKKPGPGGFFGDKKDDGGGLGLLGGLGLAGLLGAGFPEEMNAFTKGLINGLVGKDSGVATAFNWLKKNLGETALAIGTIAAPFLAFKLGLSGITAALKGAVKGILSVPGLIGDKLRKWFVTSGAKPDVDVDKNKKPGADTDKNKKPTAANDNKAGKTTTTSDAKPKGQSVVGQDAKGRDLVDAGKTKTGKPQVRVAPGQPGAGEFSKVDPTRKIPTGTTAAEPPKAGAPKANVPTAANANAPAAAKPSAAPSAPKGSAPTAAKPSTINPAKPVGLPNAQTSGKKANKSVLKMLSKLKYLKGLPGVGIAFGGVFLAVQAYEMSDLPPEQLKAEIVKAIGGALGGAAGAMIGAFLGTLVFPVVGTIAGGLLGGLIGSLGGDVLAEKLYDWLMNDKDISKDPAIVKAAEKAANDNPEAAAQIKASTSATPPPPTPPKPPAGAKPIMTGGYGDLDASAATPDMPKPAANDNAKKPSPPKPADVQPKKPVGMEKPQGPLGEGYVDSSYFGGSVKEGVVGLMSKMSHLYRQMGVDPKQIMDLANQGKFEQDGITAEDAKIVQDMMKSGDWKVGDQISKATFVNQRANQGPAVTPPVIINNDGGGGQASAPPPPSGGGSTTVVNLSNRSSTYGRKFAVGQ